jgi:hypothetical protein
MMARIDSKTNWTPVDRPVPVDFNRIENNNEQAFNEIDQEIVDRASAVTSEANARISADNNLQNNITAEANLRIAADNVLQGNINAEANARISGDDSVLKGLGTGPGDYVISGFSFDNSKTTTSSTAIKLFEFKVPFNMTVRCSFRIVASSGGLVAGGIYKNGVSLSLAVGATDSGAFYTADIPVVIGDLVQIYGNRTTGTCIISNVALSSNGYGKSIL